MNAFVKYCVLLLVAVIYLGQGIDSTRYLTKATEQERLISHEKDNFERLAMLTAMNGNALPLKTIILTLSHQSRTVGTMSLPCAKSLYDF